MEKIFFKLPYFLQNTIISFYNVYLYNTRNGGKYKKYKKILKDNAFIDAAEIKRIQKEEFLKFIEYAYHNSTYYRKLYGENVLSEIKEVEDIRKLPIVSKEDLRKNIKDVYTIPKKKANIYKTGGTTGKPLKVYFSNDDVQKKSALIDNFRNKYGYKLGKKTAWFSGKKLLNDRDIKKNRFWKHDYIHKVRYYSTFHIKESFLGYYLQNLIEFLPEYMVGFPSTMIDIAHYGIKHNIDFPKGIKTIFPTAETVTDEIREVLESYFKTKVIDQYASSEGAPFIFECDHGKYHLEDQGGIVEVLDENDEPALEGRMVVTSFSTYGTPLIRYDIGDRIKLSEDQTPCPCGNQNIMADRIMGRINDFVYSPKNGKINLGNVSNTLKGVKGMVKFQVIQNELNAIDVYIVKDASKYTEDDEKTFLKNWRDRMGDEMAINFLYVDSIATEASGKFRIVKNNIKDKLQLTL